MSLIILFMLISTAGKPVDVKSPSEDVYSEVAESVKSKVGDQFSWEKGFEYFGIFVGAGGGMFTLYAFGSGICFVVYGIASCFGKRDLATKMLNLACWFWGQSLKVKEADAEEGSSSSSDDGDDKEGKVGEAEVEENKKETEGELCV